MKKLLIVESPNKIKTIKKFLSPDFKIMSTVGHVMDLPSKKIGVTMTDDTIELEYVPLDKKEDVIADLCKEAAKCDVVYLGTDADREGEIIAWNMQQEMKKVVKKSTKIFRITYNEITKQAILEAIENPQDISMDKVAAQQARRVLDRWVGYEVSPILWKKFTRGLSAGRVQSVALRLICDREQEIREFKPVEYWSVTGEFLHHKNTLEAALTHINDKKAELKNKEETDKLVSQLKKASYNIDSIVDKQRSKKPYAPFMTSSLQQAAYNQLGFPVKKTMQIAQKLYEGMPLDDASTPVALITYMRTDSLRLSDTALDQARTFISKHLPKDYLPDTPNIYGKAKSGKTQDAHEAIRPINAAITPAEAHKFLPKDAARLYELIWKRFIASQMTPALYAQRQVIIKGGPATFSVTGSTLLFDGYLKVYAASDEEEDKDKVIMPEGLQEKDSVNLKTLKPKQHFTQPPPRFTEASLIKELEKEGIGRPSTYSAILATIQARAYTELDKKKFTPTELGMAVTKMLVEHFPDIMNTKFTAHMEEDLDKVAQGELERDKLLREFWKIFEKDLKKVKKETAKRTLEPTEITCPKCKKNKLAIRFGKTGQFLGCMAYPECDFTSNFKRDETGALVLTKAEEPQLLDEKCPNCGKQLRRLIGKFGPFVACSGYPECKYIQQNKAPFPCPSCSGDVVERRWRGGRFWGCSNYPKCKFAVFGEIEMTPCPQCKLPFLVKKVDKQGTVTLLCSDKECGYKKVQ